MLAYHAKSSLKEHYLAAAEFHDWTDHYRQGLYFDPQNLRGCAVGCWSKDPYGGHERLAQEMGVPEDLLRLADQIFEALPNGQYQAWPRRFAEAIEPGADLEGVRSRFLQWLLFDAQWGLTALARQGMAGPLLNDLRSYFDWGAEGMVLPKSMELFVDLSMSALIRNLQTWHAWDDYAKPGTRASQALAKVWQARQAGPLLPAEAAWSCRAAWAALPAFGLAMAEAFLGMLRRAPVMALEAH